LALFPCDATGHRYPGPQRTLYPAVAIGSQSRRRKLRLCSQHFDAFLEQLQLHAVDVGTDSGQLLGVACYLCGKAVVDNAQALYVTAYGDQSERQDWWAPVHEDCVEATMEDWLIQAETA
jgi:hypothetical protein